MAPLYRKLIVLGIALALVVLTGSVLLEQPEGAHVARADLQDVGVAGDQVDVLRVHHLGDGRQARPGAGLGQ